MAQSFICQCILKNSCHVVWKFLKELLQENLILSKPTALQHLMNPFTNYELLGSDVTIQEVKTSLQAGW